MYDRIKGLIIRPLCVILHSQRHDLIPVLGLARALQSQHTLLPALPRWAPKSNREPFGAIKLRLIGEKEPSGRLISLIFRSHPTHHINLSCCVYFHLQSVFLRLWDFLYTQYSKIGPHADPERGSVQSYLLNESPVSGDGSLSATSYPNVACQLSESEEGACAAGDSPDFL